LGLFGPAVAGALLLLSAPLWILMVLFADAPGSMDVIKHDFNIEFDWLIVIAVVVSAAAIFIFRDRPDKPTPKPPPVGG
jgi:hypothetical protein